MRFVSTRGTCPAVGASEALVAGLAPDGGLYVPECLPALPAAALDPGMAWPERARLVLEPFFAGDGLEPFLHGICAEAFDFPVPLVPLPAGAAGKDDGPPVRVLELFHGPTAAFKDFGARFLARCLERLERAGRPDRPLTVLVATSGDTGGAVAAAFHRRPGLELRVLFPENGVSPRQRVQLTCWDGNVRSYAVRGGFDDCQRLAKAAFRDPALAARFRLGSANSINLGRILPQAAYFAHAAALFSAEGGARPALVVPSGNLGNAVAACWARAMGAPLGRIVMAVNANRTVPDFLETGEYRPRPGIPTLANAMDVGDPSNMERLRNLYPDLSALREAVGAYSVDDASIRETIAGAWSGSGYLFCPHGAAAERVRRLHCADGPAIVVATAHPAKFETVVEPLVGMTIPLPPSLEALAGAPTNYTVIDPDLGQLFAD